MVRSTFFVSRLVSTTCLTFFISAGAQALPKGGVVTGGSATISRPATTQLNVVQQSNRAVIDWNGFDIGAGEKVKISQPSNSSILLNRINDQKPSQIFGSLSANGTVILANPNGMVFGKGANVDVGGLIATSSKIAAAPFMQQGQLVGLPGNAGAAVINEGTITAKQGGLVALVAPEAANSGRIVARAGHVQLAAGDTIAYDLYGDGLLSVAASTSEQKAIVGQSGTIDAAGGTVALSAAQAGQLIDSVVNMDGVVEATSLKGMGGTVTLSADTIALGASARIHADGAAGGGTIEIGGGYQGTGPLPWAKSVSVAEGAAITASGTRGNAAGGKVVLWSHEKTGFAGAITAKGKGSGAGGTVETSSKGALDIAPAATVDASSDTGNAGSWLLDPGNITLVHATSSASDANDSITGGTHSPTSGNDSTVSDFTINAALNGGTSVTLETSGTNTYIQTSGSPVVNYTGSGNTSFTLKATGDILMQGGGTIQSTGSGKLNVILWSDSDNDGFGKISLNPGITVLTNGGDFIAAGGLDNGANGGVASDGRPDGFARASSASGLGISSNSLINTSTGNIILRGQGYNNAGGTSQYGVQITNGSKLITTSGNITINGIGGAGTLTDYGVYISGNNTAGGTAITTTSGAILLTGIGQGSGASNYGIEIDAGARIASTGVGTITLSGTGASGGTTGNNGIYLTGAGTLITSANGAIGLTGTAGGTSGSNYGVDLAAGAQITSTGTGVSAAAITLNGTGANGTTNNYGIYLNGNGTAGATAITTANGAVSLIGIGQGSSSSNNGVRIDSGGAIASTGNGTITLSGTGASGGTNNNGIGVTGAGTLITSANGAIGLTGSAGGASTGTSNFGVYLGAGAQITSTGTGAGAAPITLVGNGGNGTNYDYGIYINGTGTAGGTAIATANGAVTLTGVGQGSTTNNYGIVMDTGSQIASTGTGALTLAGTGSASGTNNNYGVYLTSNASILNNAAALTITGIGQGSGTTNLGIDFDSASKITATTGSVTLSGTGGNGTNFNYGIQLYGNSTAGATAITTADGAISLTGLGRGSGTQDYGINLSNASLIASTGTGTISLTGTGGNGTNYNYGVYMTSVGTTISSNNGAISVTGTGGTGGTNGQGIDLNVGPSIISNGAASITMTGVHGSGGNDLFIDNVTAPVIGSSSMTGNITFNADTIYFGTMSALTRGNIIVKPRTASTTIGVNGGAGTLSLTSATLAELFPDAAGTGAGRLIIGDAAAGTGAINVNAWDLSGKTYGVELHGGSITQAGAITWNQGNAILLDSRVSDLSPAYALNDTGSLASTLTLKSAGNVVINGNMITDSGGGKLNTILWSNSGNTGSGAVSITNLTLNTQGGNFIAAGGLDDGSNGGTAGDGVPDGVAYGNASYSQGVQLLSSAITTGSGYILLRGQGYASSNGTSQRGIFLNNGATLTTTTGAISLFGTGGTGASGTDGILLNSTGTNKITTTSGTVALTGTGGVNGGAGISLSNNSSVSSTSTAAGAGSLTLKGVASSSGSGIYVYYGTVTSGYGNIQLQGTAAGSGNTSNTGIYLYYGSSVKSTGTGASAASITLSGTGGGGGLYNTGVSFYAGAVTTIDGNITGTGVAPGNGNGIALNGGGSFTSTGTGTITLTGTGGISSANQGISLSDAGTLITSVKGAISLTGVGQGSGTTDYGVYLTNDAKITSTGTGAGAATITLAGTGGNGTDSNDGIYIHGTGLANGTAVNTLDGGILLTGLGKGSGINNYGVMIDALGQIASTGTGTIVLTGSGSATGTKGHGIFLSGAGTTITSTTGAIALIGTGGSGSVSQPSQGIYINGGAAIGSTSGTIGLTGVAGSSSTSYGIQTDTGTNTIGSTLDTGNITLTADTVSLANLAVTTQGNITVKPYTASGTIGVAGGTGTLQLTTATLAELNPDAAGTGVGKLIIGDAVNATGLTTVGVSGTPWAISNKSYDIQIYGGNVTQAGHIDWTGTNNLLFAAVAGDFNIDNYSGTGIGLDKTTGAGGTLTYRATGNINFGTNVSVAAGGSSSMNISLLSDYDNSGAGYISANGFGTRTFASNGGNILIAGGNSTASGYTGYAVGNSVGAYLANVALSSGTGNIDIRGWTNGGSVACGVCLSGSATTSSGTITITGLNNNIGSASQAINLSSINVTTGSGAILINGSKTGGYGSAFQLGANTLITSTSGPITLTASDSYANGTALYTNGSNIVIGSTLDTGNITLIADTVSLANLSVLTQNNVILKPLTAGQTINVSGTPSTSGQLNLDSATLAEFSPDIDGNGVGSLIIGDAAAGTGAVNVAAWDFSGKTYDVELHGGSIVQTGGITWNQGNDILLDSRVSDLNPAYALTDAGTLASSLTLKSAGSVIIAGNMIADTGRGALKTILWSNSGGLTNGGAVSVTNLTLNTNGGNFIAAGGLDDGSNGGTAGDGVPDGFAWGTGSYQQGVKLAGSSITTGAGNILLRGHGYNISAATGAYGVFLTGGSKLAATGAGAIALTGTGGAGTNSDYGIYVNGNGTAGSTAISTVDGAVSLTGGSQGTAANNYGIAVDAMGVIRSTGAGTIALSGTGGAGNTSNTGLFLTDAGTLITSSNGAISLTGSGRGSTSGDYGIELTAGAQVNSTGTGATAAGITLNGAVAGGAVNNNSGIYINGNGTAGGTAISTVDGAVSLNGSGAGSTSGNYGILVNAAGGISSTGTGTIGLSGTGGNGSGGNIGVYLTGTGTQITSAKGAVSLAGQGGSGSANNYGIDLDSSAKISSTGTGAGAAGITLNGTGGTGNASNSGIYINGNYAPGGTAISTVDGAVLLAGNGRGTGNGNAGVYVDNAAQITSSGAGTIALNGTGSQSGTDNNIGVTLFGANTLVTSAKGAIAFNGTGGGSGNNNYGIKIESAANVASTGTGIGAASITLNGTGGNGSQGNNGLYINGYGLGVSTVDGTVTIAGTGRGIGGANYGLVTDSNARIVSTGTGTINLFGTGSQDSSNFDSGISMIGGTRVSSAYGAIALTGIGGSNGGGGNNHGIWFQGGSQITSTGTGASAATITLRGTSGAGTGFNLGIYVAGNGTAGGTAITTIDGAVSLMGLAQGTGSSNYGIDVDAMGSIKSTGSGAIALAGTSSTTGTSNEYGIYLTGSGTSISSTTGAISLTGTGGGTGSNSSNHGIYLNSSSAVSSNSGAIRLTGVAGAGAASYGIASDTGSNTIGSSGDSGNITLTADTVSLANLNVSTQNNIYVSPYTASTTIGIAGGAGTLQLSAATLGELHADVDGDGTGTLYIGRTTQNDGSGNVHVAVYSGWNSNTQFATNTGQIYFDGAQNFNYKSVRVFTNADPVIGADLSNVAQFFLAPTVGATTIGVAGGAGTVDLSSAELDHINSLNGFLIGNNGVQSGLISLGSYANWRTNATFNSTSGIAITGNQTAATGSVGDSFGFNGQTTLNGNIDLTASTGTTTIGFGGPVILGSNSAISTAASGAILFLGTVNGAHDLTVTDTGSGGVTFGGAIGSIAALGNVAITSASALSLPSIRAATVTAQTVGAYDLTLAPGTVLAASSSGTAVTLVSGRNFVNNAGASAINLSGGGRSLIYSTDPANDVRGGLNSGFLRYSCAYGGACPSFPAGGNGFLYSATPLLTVTPNAVAVTYGSAAPLTGYGYTLAGYRAGDLANDTVAGSLNGSTSYAQGANVGSYAIAYAGGSLSDVLGYGFTYATAASGLTVNQAPLTVTADNQNRAYGTANPALTGTLSGVYSGDTITVSRATSATEGSDVGSYGILNTLSDPGGRLSNYSVTNLAGALTVGQTALTVTADSASRQYGTANPGFTGSLSGVYGSDGITVSRSSTATAGSDIGAYGILNALADPNGKLGNYSIVNTAGTLTINKADLNITADTQNITYGDVIPTLTGTLTGLYAPDGITVSRSTAAVQGSSVGGYAIDNTLADPNSRLGNYRVTNDSGTLAISQATLTVTADSASRQYGTGNPGFTGTLTGVYAGDTITASRSTSAGAGSNVGGYAIANTLVDSGNRLGNYIVINDSGTLTITKADLNVTADNQTAIYGTGLPAFTGSLSGVYSGDTITVSRNTAATQGSDVGSYAIANTLFDPGNRLGNYLVTNDAGTLSITPASLTVTADNQNRIYGQNNSAFGGALTGVYGTDGITVTRASAATAGSDVGSYAISNTLADPRGKLFDYIVTNTAGTLTIGQASLSITTDDQTRLYGQSNPGFTGSITGVYGSDGITVSRSTSAGAGSNVGSYGITGSLNDPNGKLGNYTVVSNPAGTLSINPATLSIAADNQSKVYGDADPSLTYQASGLYGADGITGALTRSAGETVAGGAYAIGQGTLSAGGNYLITYSGGNFTITPRPLTVTADDASRTTAEPDPLFSYTVSGWLTGDPHANVSGVGLSTSAAANSPVGSYAITAAGGAVADSDYRLGTYVPGTLAVTAFIPVVTTPPTLPDTLPLPAVMPSASAGSAPVIAPADVPIDVPAATDTPAVVPIVQTLPASVLRGNNLIVNGSGNYGASFSQEPANDTSFFDTSRDDTPIGSYFSSLDKGDQDLAPAAGDEPAIRRADELYTFSLEYSKLLDTPEAP